jgi:hypothetical protein
MSKHDKRAGRSTREMADKRYRARVRFILPMVGLVILLLLILNVSKALKVGGFAFLAVAILVRLVMGFTDAKEKKMIREERRAVRGAKAEEEIGSILAGLSGDYYKFISDVVSPYGNIDHIVIGKRTGLFLIETKAHGGRVSVKNERLLVNGHEPEKDFIAQALRNTYWLRERAHDVTGLEIWINTLVVFTNAFVEPTPPVKRVRVINKKYLFPLYLSPS